MSRRGRSTGSPISLFSFQDIITSVTAIMILLVLILTLELITRMNLKGVAAEDQHVASELHQSLESLRTRLEDLQSAAADAKQAATRAARQSLKDVEADRRRTERSSDVLSTTIASLESQLKTARLKRRSAETDLVQAERTKPLTAREQDKATRDLNTAAMLERHNEAEQKRQEETEKELAESPTLVSTLVYNPPPGESLQPHLVEISKAGIAVIGRNDSGVQVFGWGVLGPPGAFTKWLSERNKKAEYIVLMLRPSGLDKLEATREAIRTQGLELGVELVSEDMDIVLADDAHKAS